MTNDEAMKLARELQAQMRAAMEASPGPKAALAFLPVLSLCDHILSGYMKREIENAAYERAAKLAGRYKNDNLSGAGKFIAEEIRALIQPRAQKENGK